MTAKITNGVDAQNLALSPNPTSLLNGVNYVLLIHIRSVPRWPYCIFSIPRVAASYLTPPNLHQANRSESIVRLERGCQKLHHTHAAPYTFEAHFLMGNTAAAAHHTRGAKVSGVVRSSPGFLCTLRARVLCFTVLLTTVCTCCLLCLYGLIITADVRNKCESISDAAHIQYTHIDAGTG